ncbi:hypothetical protein OROMI_013600 [Orobanche minor]
MGGAYTATLELNYMELQTSLVGCILEMAYISIRALKILGLLVILFAIQVIFIFDLATTKSKVATAKLISIIFSIIILVLPLRTVDPEVYGIILGIMQMVLYYIIGHNKYLYHFNKIHQPRSFLNKIQQPWFLTNKIHQNVK